MVMLSELAAAKAWAGNLFEAQCRMASHIDWHLPDQEETY